MHSASSQDCDEDLSCFRISPGKESDHFSTFRNEIASEE